MQGYKIIDGIGIIPADTTVIKDGAFENCTELTSIVIPDFVTEVEDCAFRGCVNLRSIKVDPGNGVYDSREDCNAIIETETNSLVVGCAKTKIPQGVKVIEDYAFYDCKGLKSIEIPATVERIGMGAFDSCYGLKNIVIPASVTEIDVCAFRECVNLKCIEIPASVTEIGEDAFDVCDGLTSIKVDPNNGVYDSREDCNALIETASNTLLRGCPTSKIPEGVTTIGRGAFADVKNLTNVEIPASVKVIEGFAFTGCGMEQLELPPSVEEIGESAFQNCAKLKSVIISSSVKVIGKSAFFDCPKLESVEILSSEVEIGDGAFEDCPAVKTVKMPYVKEYHGWFVYSVNLTNVEMPSVEVIGDNAFAGQKKLKKLVFTELLEVGEDAFKGCTGLTNIMMPRVVEIKSGAFYGCTKLKVIEISSVQEVGVSAFAGCTALESVELPSLEAIGDEAFCGCSALKSVKVSSNEVETGAGLTFDGCDNLISFEFLTAKHGNEFDNYDLLEHRSLKEIIVPAGTGKRFKEWAKDMFMDKIIVERKPER